MNDNKKVINRKPSMTNVELFILVLYLSVGMFGVIAAQYHIGCWPGRGRTDVPVCSQSCFLGIDLEQYRHHPAQMKKEFVPLVPCWPY